MREAWSDAHHPMGQSRSSVMTDYLDELRCYLELRGLRLEGDETQQELTEAYDWIRKAEEA